MQFKIPANENDFKSYFHTRWETLRKPWNQPEGSEKDELEETSFHGMLTDQNGNAVAVCRLQRINEKQGQIRYMGVKENYRGMGYGKTLLDEMEKLAIKNDISSIMLQAREEAVPFYEK